jgi:hypothetical protein
VMGVDRSFVETGSRFQQLAPVGNIRPSSRIGVTTRRVSR